MFFLSEVYPTRAFNWSRHSSKRRVFNTCAGTAGVSQAYPAKAGSASSVTLACLELLISPTVYNLQKWKNRRVYVAFSFAASYCLIRDWSSEVTDYCT